MGKKIIALSLLFLPLLASAETIIGRYVSEMKNDVSFFVKGATKMVRPDKKGRFAIKNVNVEKDTVVVKSPRFENSVFIPLNGTSLITITENNDLLDVELKKAPIVPTGEYNGIIITQEELARTGERLALSAINVKIPRQNMATTFNGNTEPLYFMDGMLTADISDVPLSEIAYAEVVRASNPEVAAMGARGANGMILLTSLTKFHVEHPDWNAQREFSMQVAVSIREIPKAEKGK